MKIECSIRTVDLTSPVAAKITFEEIAGLVGSGWRVESTAATPKALYYILRHEVKNG